MPLGWYFAEQWRRFEGNNWVQVRTCFWPTLNKGKFINAVIKQGLATLSSSRATLEKNWFSKDESFSLKVLFTLLKYFFRNDFLGSLKIVCWPLKGGCWAEIELNINKIQDLTENNYFFSSVHLTNATAF